MRDDSRADEVRAFALKHRALARAMMQRLIDHNLALTQERWEGIISAATGRYRHSPPVSPIYFGFTEDEFQGLRALIYGV